MKKLIIYSAMFISLTSCARSCGKLNRSFQTSARNNEVVMYSGGDTVFYDKFNGIINNAENSDGAYYYKGDTLIELSGDYIIKSTK